MLKVIGVTGTNGKTTITYILQTILKKAGYKVAVNGTLTGRLTTPSPWDLQKKINFLRKQNYDYLIMEASSHGIFQDRIKGIYFVAKLLTNITQDHLDYHKTWWAYRKVKLGWMKRGEGIKIYPKDYKKLKIDYPPPFLGEFNYKNFQAAIAVAKALGVKEEVIEKAIKEVKAVPGRFENINCGQKYKVIVDYAHTPDGLQNVLKTARQILKKQKTGKLITVFGCGGDRDKGKRPKMGRISRKLSDLSIVTSDNPRSEDPQKIIKDILVGMCRKHNNGYIKLPSIQIETDRRKAINAAIKIARDNDLVLIAGKGHENYQILKNKRIHFDDREEAQKAIKKAKK
ncbi:MAG: UDP-N-acetylmuramoyl-L-alanyl-D-glutamate--2,6-diaminopimelate ligase [Candidatus Margulisbacteria bacterium]|nr:UDP-N-acetylmuramoyl-L-alanyl-D-glutamate--2,6-diaminopimelate ligase [Candidatus Margulisiibacteriota bacterium]